eukprot:TRINITY_DN1157_c0_g1_i1.p1 TRINITY_DN1157_c0_g1~~TRINITY_DN1157_c0_g1_i1.p1  ORF type:complete len:656 (-),score=118.22 TRINITY_DN1157_c0_g1_i1:70-2037(-)
MPSQLYCVRYYLPPKTPTGRFRAWTTRPSLEEVEASAPKVPPVFLTYDFKQAQGVLADDANLESAWLIAGQDLLVVVYDSDAARTAAVTGVATGATAAGKRRRVEACASDFSKPSAAKSFVPGCSPPQRSIFFYAGREHAVDAATAIPVAQVSPEFGLIKDAAHGRLAGRVPGHFVEAAEQLCATMALIYDNEAARQAAFHQWLNKYLPGFSFVAAPESSNSIQQISNSSTSGPVNSDGHCAIAGTETDDAYVILIVVVKNEEASSGDGYFEVLRYYQDAFGNGDGTRNDDAVVRATGAPALGITIAGPHLAINGMYFKEPNVVVAEPLMNTATLIDLTLREEAQMMHLARVLAALSAAAWNLRRRYCMEKQLAVRNGAFGYSLEALQLFTQQAPDRNYVQRFKEVVQLHSSAQKLASLRGPPLSANPLVPYPLLSTPGISDAKTLDIKKTLIFTANYREPAGAAAAATAAYPVVVKSTPGPYPKQIHKAWQALGLVPQLHYCETLPGGGCMVAIQYLSEADGWRTLYDCFNSPTFQRAEADALLTAVDAALRSMHSAPIDAPGCSGEAAKAVHGDVRDQNIMVRRKPTENFNAEEWEVNFIDLDWAGIAGVSWYPAGMNRTTIRWAPGVRGGELMLQEHDLYMVEQMRPLPMDL